jgi:hypothetical protein
MLIDNNGEGPVLPSIHAEWSFRHSLDPLSKVVDRYEDKDNIILTVQETVIKTVTYNGVEKKVISHNTFYKVISKAEDAEFIEDWNSKVEGMIWGDWDIASPIVVGTVITKSSRAAKSAYKWLNGPLHHIFTNKNYKAGKQWSKVFEPIFKKAGYKLDDAINKVFVPGHKGPHPEEYHEFIYDQLTQALKGKKGKEYKEAFEGTMKKLADMAQEEGSYLNKLLKKE